MKKTFFLIVILFTITSYSQTEIEKAKTEIKNAKIELEKAEKKLEQLKKLEQQKKELLKSDTKQTELQKTDTKQTETNEPEWVGQVYHIDNNGKTSELESQKAYLKANASASMYIIGIGKVKAKWTVKGNKSSFRIKSNNHIKFIVNAGSNSINPKSVIKIIKLLTDKKNKRYYVGSSTGTFTGSETGNLKLVNFIAKKYGKSSYQVEIPNVGDGEYALIINNSLDWNLFGIE